MFIFFHQTKYWSTEGVFSTQELFFLFATLKKKRLENGWKFEKIRKTSLYMEHEMYDDSLLYDQTPENDATESQKQ